MEKVGFPAQGIEGIMSWYKKAALPAIAGVAAAAAALIMPHEGEENTAYLDPVGIPTVCYGHTATVDRQDVRDGLTLTDEQCAELLRGDMQWAIEAVEGSLTVPASDLTRGAFVSFVYNVGPTAWRNSTALKKMNAGDYRGACDELLRWVYAGGRYLKGLENRRHAEREVCIAGLED